MPIRNPFARRGPGVAAPQDENVRPGSSGGKAPHPGFERVDTVGSKASSALSVRSRRSQDTGEYKMSVVNDSGVYLPPSPTEREPSWPRRYLSSRTSTETRSSLGDIEHFSISRESFDSYRRSFDISARSPVIVTETPPRQSLDSALFANRLPRSAVGDRRLLQQKNGAAITLEEPFEDVGLNDDSNRQFPQQQQQHHQQPPSSRRKGFLAKFASSDSASSGAAAATAQDSSAPSTPGANTGSQPMSAMARFIPGRKRAHSGQGAELGVMPTSPKAPSQSPLSANDGTVASPPTAAEG
ncbi:hypothetical protein VTK73DRAFT_2666 [Phialemonium thermophilum]|uniref:Uncharacterized protein n=1 Tax=Phialemonium thermophilum TaxID=223376 RepID=A0ABR3X2Y0_9PEZI